MPCTCIRIAGREQLNLRNLPGTRPHKDQSVVVSCLGLQPDLQIGDRILVTTSRTVSQGLCVNGIAAAIGMNHDC